MNRKENRKDISDAELVREFMDGSMKAFDVLVVRYQDMIFNLCMRMLGDYDEASDAAQETFIKTYRGLGGFKFKSSFTTWLYRITVNSCKNRLSSSHYRQSRRAASIDHRGPDQQSPSLEVADARGNPERILIRRECEREVLAAIDSLPEKQKVLVVLRDIDGKSYEEISEITGINTGTVKSRIARAREKLRDGLRGVI